MRHSFNVCGEGGPLPEEDVPGFNTAVQELSGDFKQLATMLLTVRFFVSLPQNVYLNSIFQNFDKSFSKFLYLSYN